MILSQRYSLAVRVALVAVLFILHSCVLYKCVLDGRNQNNADTSDANPQFEIPIEPMYSLRVHFINSTLESWAVGPADVLFFSFLGDGNYSAATKHFEEERKWQFVLPLHASHDIHLETTHRLSERQFSFAARKSPVLTVIRVRDAFILLKNNTLTIDSLPHKGIAAVFLIEEDPLNIKTPWGGTLRDELVSSTQSGRVPAMAEHLGRIHGAKWAFFISPCQSNQVFSWDIHHIKFFQQSTLSWVCVSSDSFIELSAESRLVSVVYDNV